VVENGTVEVGQGEPRTVTLFGSALVLKLSDLTSDPTAELTEDASRPSNIKLNVHDAYQEGISCPILYSWDATHSEWVKHGKVIDTANAPEKETTSLVDVATDVRKIRLSEEEPEVSFVRAVQLILTLRDGRRITVDPVGMPRGRLAPWLRIPAYHWADVRFDVPAEYESIGIERAQVAVTGYYERTGSLLLSRLVRPVGRPN
jgi:hypothetical protein